MTRHAQLYSRIGFVRELLRLGTPGTSLPADLLLTQVARILAINKLETVTC